MKICIGSHTWRLLSSERLREPSVIDWERRRLLVKDSLNKHEKIREFIKCFCVISMYGQTLSDNDKAQAADQIAFRLADALCEELWEPGAWGKARK